MASIGQRRIVIADWKRKRSNERLTDQINRVLYIWNFLYANFRITSSSSFRLSFTKLIYDYLRKSNAEVQR
jgi:hypothetical protein